MIQGKRTAVPEIGLAVLTMLTLAIARPAAGGQNVWTAIGPDGDRVNELVVDPADPRRAWAATDTGVFTTGDGQHWRRLPLDDYVVALALDPRGPALYASGLRGDHGYVIRSDDGGESWGPRVPVFCETVDELAVDARDPDTVYAADGYRSVATSRDGGVTWRVAEVDGLLRDALAVDPHRAGRVYAAGVGGVFRSDDFGTTWTFSATPGNSAFPIAVDGTVPDVVFTSDYEGSLLRSRDAGQTWEPFGTGIPGVAIPALASDAVSGTLYAGTARGVFRSDDGGATWTATALDPHQVGHLAVVGSTVYAAIGGAGIARSDDGGASWERASAGLGQASGAVAVGADGALYVASSGVFRSRDRGRTWTLSARGLRDSGLTALAPHPTRAATLYAGTRSGVFVSDDAGDTWRPTGLVYEPELYSFAREVRALAVDPVAPEHLWAVTWEGLYRSADGGETWTRDGHRYLRHERLAHIALDPRRSGTVWVGGEGPCGLLRSRDGGASWQRLCRRDAEFTALAVDPRRPDALYAGLRTHDLRTAGLYRSVDGGRHWTPVLQQPIDAVAIEPLHQNRLVTTGWRHIYRSDDGGESWYPFTAGLERPNVNSLAFAPGPPNLVLAGTWDGIYAVEPVEPCRGDCGGDGRVTVDDVVGAVAIGLGEADRGSCAVADRNADGRVDIAEIIAAVADAMTGCADVAAAAWEAPQPHPLQREPRELFAADVDRDGRVDALLVDGEGVQLWRGDGTGALAPRPHQALGWDPFTVQMTDLDGDGAPDLLARVAPDAGASPDAVRVLLNDGGGTFRTAGDYGFAPPRHLTFATGDVDGDGVADLVLGDASGTVAVHRGRGDGSFAPPSLLASGGCTASDCPWLSAVADLNGDGAADIVLDWTVLLGAGDGTFAAPISGGGSGQFVDLDGDAVPDRLLADSWDEAFVAFPGAGDGTFAPALTFPTGATCVALAVADVNRDRTPDVVCGGAPWWDDGTPAAAGRLGVMRNLGDGAFTIPQLLSPPFRPDAVAVADLDGDGRLDLLAAGHCRAADAPCRANGAGMLAVWRGAGR